MYNLNQSKFLNKATIQLMAIILINGISNLAYSAFTQVQTFTDSYETFYTIASSDGEQKTGYDPRYIMVPIGASVKIEFIIPPGVDQFVLSEMVVSNWAGGNGGEVLYAHSFNDFNDADSYFLMSSSGYTPIFWIYDVPEFNALSITPSSVSLKGYLIIKNSSGNPWFLDRMTAQMRISDSLVYNAWVNGGSIPLPTPLVMSPMYYLLSF